VVTQPQRESRRQEKDGAVKLGGRVQPASGSLPTLKNDARTDRNALGMEFSVEYKTTGSTQFPLKLRELRAAETHATVDSRYMGFGVRFTTGRPGQHYDYVVLSDSDFHEMQNRIIELEKSIASYHRMGGFAEENKVP
jgi:hypothetical protein